MSSRQWFSFGGGPATGWLLVLLLSLSSTSAAFAQFNIKIGYEGIPSSSFGAAADQAGPWNIVALSANRLVDIHGRTTNVSMSVSGDIGSFSGNNLNGNTGDYAALLNTFMQIGGPGPGFITWTF